MSQNRTFKHTQKQYISQMPNAQATANTAKNAQTPNTSENGAKNSGTHSQMNLQYGKTSFSESATSQNGGASVINISDKAKAIQALSEELKDLENLQLEVGEQMATLLFNQMRLAENAA